MKSPRELLDQSPWNKVVKIELISDVFEDGQYPKLHIQTPENSLKALEMLQKLNVTKGRDVDEKAVSQVLIDLLPILIQYVIGWEWGEEDFDRDLLSQIFDNYFQLGLGFVTGVVTSWTDALDMSERQKKDLGTGSHGNEQETMFAKTASQINEREALTSSTDENSTIHAPNMGILES